VSKPSALLPSLFHLLHVAVLVEEPASFVDLLPPKKVEAPRGMGGFAGLALKITPNGHWESREAIRESEEALREARQQAD
jgi:hypothetical protein